jgi:2-polyprenyl-3-methyl-5-hydroxy-6-metoxy-1,4-benzoquinol methylase
MYDYSKLRAVPNSFCIVCNSKNSTVIGKRGNREYFGADKSVEPHCVTNVVECNNCKFVYIDPTFEGIDEVEAVYYSSIELYVYDLEKKVSDMFQKRVDIIKRYCKGVHGIDVGPGKGEFLNQLTQNDFVVEGVEPSSNFCEFGRENFNLVMHNTTLDKFESERDFDFISSVHSLEHMNSPHSFFQSAHRLLNDDGILFVEVPNTDATMVKIIDMLFKIIGRGWSSKLCPLHQPFHKYGYNSNALRHILEANAFVIDEVFTLTGTDRGYTRYKGIAGIISWTKYLLTQLVDVFGQKECLVVIARKCT